MGAMGWRKLVARREERRVKEDHDLPGSMRQGSPDGESVGLLLLAVAGALAIGVWIYSAWTSGDRELALILAGMVIVAVGIVVSISRSHRARNATTMRTPPRAQSIDWEE